MLHGQAVEREDEAWLCLRQEAGPALCCPGKERGRRRGGDSSSRSKMFPAALETQIALPRPSPPPPLECSVERSLHTWSRHLTCNGKNWKRKVPQRRPHERCMELIEREVGRKRCLDRAAPLWGCQLFHSIFVKF